jgi:hypothetical protein
VQIVFIARRQADSDRRSRRDERPRTLELDHVSQVEEQLLGVSPADDLH